MESRCSAVEWMWLSMAFLLLVHWAAMRGSLTFPGALCARGAKPSRLARTRLVPRMLDADMCPGKKSSLSELDCHLHDDDDHNTLLDCTGFVNRTAKSISQLVFNITKCAGQVSFNTCEYYQTLKYGAAVCSLMASPGMPWSNISLNIRPPKVKCPFEAGHYRLENGSINMDAISALPYPLEGNTWLVEMEIYDERPKLYMCFRATMQYLRRRVGGG